MKGGPPRADWSAGWVWVRALKQLLDLVVGAGVQRVLVAVGLEMRTPRGRRQNRCATPSRHPLISRSAREASTCGRVAGTSCRDTDPTQIASRDGAGLMIPIPNEVRPTSRRQSQVPCKRRQAPARRGTISARSIRFRCCCRRRQVVSL